MSVGPTGREINLGLADRFSGGNKTSDASTYERANGSVALGARASREDATATWLFDETINTVFRQLDNGVGEWRAIIIRTPLADDRTPMVGAPAITLRGQMTGVSMPDTDYSSSDGAEVEITFNLDAALA